MLHFCLSIIIVNCQALSLQLFQIPSTMLENAGREDTSVKNVKVTVIVTVIVRVILFVSSVVVLQVCQDVVAKEDYGISLAKIFAITQIH